MNAHRRHTFDIPLLAGVPRLKQRALPELDAAAHHAWREGWWQGLAVGVVLGAAACVILLLKG